MHFGEFDSFVGDFGGWCVDFCKGGEFGGSMNFGFEGVDQFGCWHFEEEMVVEG